MAIHRDARHIHIGCDEVFHLGECPACAGQSRTDLFIKHVANVAQYVKTKYPQVQTVIIWDDMLRYFLFFYKMLFPCNVKTRPFFPQELDGVGDDAVEELGGAHGVGVRRGRLPVYAHL